MARIALIGENSTSFVKELIDIWNSGDCAVLIDWRTPISAAIEMMREAKVSECRIEKEIFDKSGELNSTGVKFLTFERDKKAQLLPQSIYDSFKENYSTSEAVIIYSSGTTGKAKGIILSHYAINTNADAIIDYMKPTINDSIYIVKSLSHSSTLTGELLVALKSKIMVLIAPTIVPPRYVFNNLIKYSITILCVNPTLLSMYADERKRHEYKLPSLRVMYVSGSILSDKTYKVAHEAFKDIVIYNVYGLSEAGPRVTAQRADCCQNNSVGKTIKNVKIKIVNEKGSIVPDGEYGIAHVKTPSIFDGYIVGQNKHDSLYEDWYNTGDVGYIDTNGELHIINRLDDVIIIDSHKVYPSEVEKKIIEQSNVKECAVAKVELNGNEFIGCLYAGEKEIDRDIKEKLKSKLLAYEIPRFFLKCDALPRTKNGKISTREVQACLRKYISQE